MARRREAAQATLAGGGPPAELLAGPLITRWAKREHLDRVAATTEGTQEHRDAVGDAMVNARTQWRDAVHLWVQDNGVDELSQRRLFTAIPSRRPYWPPETN